MTETFLDYDQLERFSMDAFLSKSPFPWHNFASLLTPEGFATLNADFPPLALFEKHEGIERPHDQRPQNRYYLGYEGSIYHEEDGSTEGIARRVDLAPSWQRFMDELREEPYQSFLKGALGGEEFLLRCTWHLGFSGSEVCPHVDAKDKLATHIFYFNPVEEWDPSWGGSTLVLRDKTTEALNPEFEDFREFEPVTTVGNASFFFKNMPTAWHGVRPLACPDGAYRKLFNVVCESPRHYEKPRRGLARLLLR